MRRVIVSALLLILVALGEPFLASAADGSQTAPKLINFFLGYEIKDDDPAKLARWDIVVLDMDQQFQFPDKVRQIRALNPRVKILAYVSAGEISQARFSGHPDSPGNQLARSVPESWLMHRADGSRVSWWSGNMIMNATSKSPSFNGWRWQTFLGPFIQEQMMGTGLWDGVFLDSAYGDITSFVGTGLDLDQDGIGETPKEADEAWRVGMRELVRNVKATLGEDKIVMANGSVAYADEVNGILIENFPRFGWTWPFQELRTSLAENLPLKVSAFNTNTENQERKNDYRLMRYGLTSALIADGYFSFDAGDANHHRTWWYDEYTASIGNPKAKATTLDGVWMRPFERGLVLVNPTKQPVWVDLSAEYERLLGRQDPYTNNGELTRRVVVPPEDGLVLLRPLTAKDIVGANYRNGDFLQVYDGRGARVRNGFFAVRNDVRRGAMVLPTDRAKNPYRVMGDVDGDGSDEIVVGSGPGRAPLVQVFDASGHLQSQFVPLGTSVLEGIRPVVADIDGNGAAEILLPSSPF
jgi:hypothetical protein